MGRMYLAVEVVDDDHHRQHDPDEVQEEQLLFWLLRVCPLRPHNLPLPLASLSGVERRYQEPRNLSRSYLALQRATRRSGLLSGVARELGRRVVAPIERIPYAYR